MILFKEQLTDLVESIFEKIETCDILVADLSIINAESNCRPTPNPNVLLEVGFAAKAISWSNILCIYNCEYGKVELLPFDIRTRKPIIYNTIEGIPELPFRNCVPIGKER